MSLFASIRGVNRICKLEGLKHTQNVTRSGAVYVEFSVVDVFLLFFFKNGNFSFFIIFSRD
jgi:hypothetical protein